MLSKTALKISTYSASGENLSKLKKRIFPWKKLCQFIYIYLSILVHFIISKWSLHDIVESNSFITPVLEIYYLDGESLDQSTSLVEDWQMIACHGGLDISPYYITLYHLFYTSNQMFISDFLSDVLQI